MLGFLKRLNAEAATYAVINDMVRAIKARIRDVPSSVWQDAYLTAYMQKIMAVLLKENSHEKLSGEKLGMAMGHVWENATGEDRATFLRRAAALTEATNSETTRGFRDAALWLSFYFRTPDFDDERARKIYQQAKQNDRNEVAALRIESDALAAATALLFRTDVLLRVRALNGEASSQA